MEYQNIGKVRSKGRPVIKYDLDGNFIQEFPSITAAAKTLPKLKGKLNSIRTGIWRVCSGEEKTCRGFQWRYKDRMII